MKLASPGHLYHAKVIASICKGCGAVFADRIATYPRRYCSTECRDGHKEAMVVETIRDLAKKCQTCGQEFQARNHTQKYCSGSCRSSFRQTTKAGEKHRRAAFEKNRIALNPFNPLYGGRQTEGSKRAARKGYLSGRKLPSWMFS